MSAPDNARPYGLYFIIGFIVGTAACMALSAPLRVFADTWPLALKLAMALAPFVLGLAYGARMFAFGRAEQLGVRAAMLRALPFRGP